MTSQTPEEFVGEALMSAAGTADVKAMACGKPGLPDAFIWREREYRIAGVLKEWKTSGPCRSGSKEMYLRRHWYKVLTDCGLVMTLYFDRQAKDSSRPKARWWLYTVCRNAPGR